MTNKSLDELENQADLDIAAGILGVPMTTEEVRDKLERMKRRDDN